MKRRMAIREGRRAAITAVEEAARGVSVAEINRALAVVSAYEAGCPLDSIATTSAMDQKSIRRVLTSGKPARYTHRPSRHVQVVALDQIKSSGSKLSEANMALDRDVTAAAGAGCSTRSISTAGGYLLWDDYSDLKRAVKRRRGRV